jgi:thioesterase domain-containing protein/acyl carrier protein
VSDEPTHHKLKEDYLEPRTDVERQMADIWKEVLRVDRIGVNDRFAELGGDSLRVTHVLAKMEKRFGVAFTVIEFYREQTIAGLARLLEKKRQSAKNLEPENLVLLQPHGSKSPLFLVHAVDGDLFTYAYLVKALGNERPIYGFQLTEASDQIAQHYRIVEMARSYLGQMKAVRPTGPYNLAGFSGGGIIAYEVAQQLRASGDNVGFLGVIDVEADISGSVHEKYRRRRIFFREALFFLEDLNPNSRRGKQARDLGTSLELRSRAVSLCKLGLSAAGLVKPPKEPVLPGSTVTMPESRKRMWRALSDAVTSYVCKPYDGKVTVLKGDAPGLTSSPYPAWGWEKLARNVHVVNVPGKLHGSQLKPPNVDFLAKKINELME